ncbi:Fasciclin domain-containing protein [Phanerochaete sordida]|uniref:Fasciclin domain-containing protein n=1 Tax=Phanerochaete sordida TaxID=48140 RepID=A0A9P3L9Z6_9APHY|nr:Fasciclin domain-containing protein [Phanerochaete sordida]
MRLLSLPLSLLALLPAAYSSQVSFQTNVSISSTNIVDVLSADPDYSSLLGLLQRAKLIPTLNKLNATTLFAPTNKAIKRHAKTNALWSSAFEGDSALRDNIQEKLRQELFYHMLNYTFSPMPQDSEPAVLKTMHYPRKPTEPPSQDPPPSPPWMPLPGGTLGGEPQRLRAASRNDAPWAGVDAFGKGGVKVSKEVVNASNGVVIGIDDVLEVPPDLATVVLHHPSLSYLRNILTPELVELLNSTSEMTLFLPVDKAWEALPPYERLYLESKFATDDLTRIVNMHATEKTAKQVYYSESFSSSPNLTTIDGQVLEVRRNEGDGKTKISSAELVEPDIYASNGVVHTISELLVPPDALQFTPEKYLLVLNCTSFVSLLHSVNLTSLINDTDAHWTILAPRDDIIDILGDDGLPPPGSEELKKMLQYHFIPGKKTREKLKSGMLLETALEEVGLDGGRQVLSVDVSEGVDDKGSIAFGGAGIIGEPVSINNTLIYFVTRPLTPPIDPLATAVPTLDLSIFLSAIFSTSMAEKLKTTPRTTFLMPHNGAFKRLGALVTTHLLTASSKVDLENVIQHHVISGVEYARSLVNGSQRTYATLEGSDLHVERKKAKDNSTVMLSASGGWVDMHSLLYPRDTLTETGVIHEISDVMLPRSVNLTIGKLMRAAKGTNMISLITKAGLEWILNGTAPPEGTPWADMGLDSAGWTVLCPPDEAFKGLDLKELYADPEKTRDLVLQHLVPVQRPSQPPSEDAFVAVVNENRPLVMDDSATYTTLLTTTSESLYSDVVFRVLEDKGTVVGIKGARGADGKNDWAHVTAWGRSTIDGGSGGVVQIDALLLPYYPSPWVRYGGPIAVGVVGTLLNIVFFYAVWRFWKRDTTEATYEPVGGFGQDHEEDE